MLRILLLTYYYHPEENPRVFRWRAIVSHWISLGYSVDVVCRRPAGCLSYEQAGLLTIYRTGFSLKDYIRRRLIGKRDIARGNNSTDPGGLARLGLLFSSIYWLYNKFIRKLFWPDYACFWLFSARRKVKKLISHYSYDGCISVSEPFSSHLLGLYVKKRLPDLTWLVDIGDPFYFSNHVRLNSVVYRPLNKFIESKVFSKASQLAVTNDSIMHKYSNRFNCGGKIIVIPPLLSFDPDSYVIANKTIGSLVFLFAGVLYANNRSPDFLLELFSRLLRENPDRNVELHFYGNIGDTADIFRKYHALIGSNIYLHGQVARSLLLRAMAGADVLVNIGNFSEVQLPSKLVDYISMGKPILNLAKHCADSSAIFLRDYPYCLSLAEDEKRTLFDQAQDLNNFITKLPEVDSTIIDNFRSRFKVSAIAGTYLNILGAGL